jgi:hypothetical protein
MGCNLNKRFYQITRDLHLYLGLFISPFVLVFSCSVVFLAYTWIPGTGEDSDLSRATASNLTLALNLNELSGRALVGVIGEVEFIRHVPKEHRLIVPVTVPGRQTVVNIDLQKSTAEITQRTTGIWDAMVVLHKSPGPHMGAVRMNWFMFRVWRWLADSTAYALLFISVSGIYLWVVLRAERRIGLALLVTGACSFLESSMPSATERDFIQAPNRHIRDLEPRTPSPYNFAPSVLT